MGSFTGPTWSEGEATRLPLYAVTGGKTTPSQHMRLTTLVRTRKPGVLTAPSQQAEQILALCEKPCPVAEVAGRLGVSVHLTKIILSELIGSGAITLALPPTAATDVEVTEVLLARLKRKFAV